MKTTKTMSSSIRKSAILILILLFTVFSYSQESSFNLERQFKMPKPDSNTRNITLNVESKASTIAIQIMSEITNGELTITILNPLGATVGEFSIESSNKTGSSTEEIVSGKIEKFINDPAPGKWTVRIDSIDSVGNVRFISRVISND